MEGVGVVEKVEGEKVGAGWTRRGGEVLGEARVEVGERRGCVMEERLRLYVEFLDRWEQREGSSAESHRVRTAQDNEA